MDSKDGAAVNTERSYEDFQPPVEWMKEESRVLELSIPDFKKEHLSVKLDAEGNLKISGERPLNENKWKRFTHSIQVPKNSKIADFNAKFSSGVLRITLPKSVTKLQDQPQPVPGNNIPEQGQQASSSTAIATKTVPTSSTTTAAGGGETSKQQDHKISGGSDLGSTKFPGDLKADDREENIKGGEKIERMHMMARSGLAKVVAVVMTVMVVGAFTKYMLGAFSSLEDLEGI